MNLHTDDFAKGINDILELYKTGSNVFEMGSGSIFPHNTSQKTWDYVKSNDNSIHLSDGIHTYSFKGDLSDMDTQLEKMPDIPLPDLYKNVKAKGKAQVHRSDPGSVYFTLQEGHNNPTYTLKHEGNSSWKAIKRPHKVKDMLKQPLTQNVNLETVKAGMLKELEEFNKEGEGPNFFSQASHALGRGVESLANLPSQLALAPARIGGPVSYANDPNEEASEGLGSTAINGLLAGGVGAGGGLAYHLLGLGWVGKHAYVVSLWNRSQSSMWTSGWGIVA